MWSYAFSALLEIRFLLCHWICLVAAVAVALPEWNICYPAREICKAVHNCALKIVCIARWNVCLLIAFLLHGMLIKWYENLILIYIFLKRAIFLRCQTVSDGIISCGRNAWRAVHPDFNCFSTILERLWICFFDFEKFQNNIVSVKTSVGSVFVLTSMQMSQIDHCFDYEQLREGEKLQKHGALPERKFSTSQIW